MNENPNAAVVLIVDDDELVRMTLNVMVGSFGYHCLVAGGGKEAIAVLDTAEIDLVLSDIVMPGMSGLELLSYIRKNHEETGVIIATGFEDHGTYAEVIKSGAIDFIKKPIDQAELEAKLARALRERAMLCKLEQLSKQDDLTGIFNRRAFQETFPLEVERAHRQGYPLMLAMLDIDNFKQYNDKLGHQEGDKVLIGLARILQQCTRENVDISFRLGGDEFAVLLPQANADQGTEIVQRILLSFVEQNFDTTTLSIGLISCCRNPSLPCSEDEQEMLKRADRAMYEAKNSGKNCVVTKV